METLTTRALTNQLADDLAWLEQHARAQHEQGRSAGLLRLTAALVRNCLGPFLDGQPPSPLHVVVVGGAGAGKSTVSNMLAGSVAAEANPQAGFTRHPIAYTSATGPISWAAHLGFLGPLTRLTQPGPSSLDEDVYQVRRVPADPTSYDLLTDFVVWDCPDMTTWAAAEYVPRLIEAAGLADVIVYVASDERYNDEVPTQFLRMLLQTGKPVVCVLMKMKEADVPALVAHFHKEVIGGMGELGRGVLGVLAIPHLTHEQLADPIKHAGKYRIPLLNQVAVLGNPALTARKRTIAGACRFLTRHQDALFAVARQDMQALDTWQGLVEAGRLELEGRYFREYLMSEQFRGFDDALVRLVQLLDFPGAGQLVSGTLYVIRTPFRLIAGLVGKAVTRPQAPTRPEGPILEDALNGWVDLLRKEAARRAGEHPLWAHINEGFQSGLAQQAREQFAAHYRNYQTQLAQEVDQTARAIYERLQQRPVLLNSLRTSKLALDAAAIGGAIVAGGIGWHDLILVPLAASVTQGLVHVFGQQFVNQEREATRQRQQHIMHQSLARPLAEWLVKWPSTGGSAFERLQLALRRLPAAVKEMEARVRQAAMAMHEPARA